MKKGADKELAVPDPRVQGLSLWQKTFLRQLSKEPNVKLACSAARVSTRTAYTYRDKDENFASLWKEALDGAIEQLEATAFALAMKGDSTLLQFLLRSHKPSVYRESYRHEIGLLGGIVVVPPKEDKSP